MKLVKPSKLKGSVTIPASKSLLQRYIIAALLCDGISTIENINYCEDIYAMLQATSELGARNVQSLDKITIQGSPPARKATSDKKIANINCSESGLCMRIMCAILPLYGGSFMLTGKHTLLARPLPLVEKPLKQLGITCSSLNNFPPINITGKLKGGKAVIDASSSSQFLSGLLMALPLAPENSQLEVLNPSSIPYIDLTLSVLDECGIDISHKDYQFFSIPGNQKYENFDTFVEGDWSSAAFLLVAGAIAGEITLKGINLESTQGDSIILHLLHLIGAHITPSDDSVTIRKSSLKAFNYDATHTPDLFPPLVVLAAYCDGTSQISGVNRLIYKESNRAETLMTQFKILGIQIHIEDNIMFIENSPVSGGVINSFGDHRIAMAGAVAALGAKAPVTIKDDKCVSKSYPSFYKHLKSIGGDIS